MKPNYCYAWKGLAYWLSSQRKKKLVTPFQMSVILNLMKRKFCFFVEIADIVKNVFWQLKINKTSQIRRFIKIVNTSGDTGSVIVDVTQN